MPIIQVNMLQGRSVEAKRKFASELTVLVCEHLNVRPEQVRVILNEMPHDNYAIGGVLAADRNKV